MKTVFVGWTTVATEQQAQTLAERAVAEGLAACVQISGPVRSVYKWQGALETESEYRLTLKFAEQQLEDLTDWILSEHPYELPQWVVVRADRVSESYRRWVESASGGPGDPV